MRIAFFTDSYLPNVDGVVTSLLGYKKELEEMGHEVFVFCPGNKKQKEENKDDKVYYFTSASFKPYPDYRVAVFPFFSAVKKVKEYNADIIHSHGIATTGLAAIQCANKLKIPAIASFHTLAPEGVHYLSKNQKIQDFFKSVAWKYLKWYYSNFKTVIIPSHYMKKILDEQGISNTLINPTGIDFSRFNKPTDPKSIRKKYNIKNNPIILHVGRIALEKRLEILINSADNVLNIYPDAKFIIVGKGPAEEHYKQLIQSKGLSKNFIFTGYVAENELPDYYSAADVFVFPSDFDTQGLVILESMSVGTPVVVKSNSAPSEFVKEGFNGYIFSDHFDLPGKIINAIKNKDKLRDNAISESKKYTIRKSSERLAEIYSSMISSP
ncbi:MAG: glycosyltransferase [Candidatus ainarchaeum sp.]|nr:glycosyltransferase [Candidatus ainarchaeum sp.]